jgi:hypothetical protein
MANRKAASHLLYGIMTAFDVQFPQEDDEPWEPPADFVLAKMLWKKGRIKYYADILSLLSKYAVAAFLPTNIDDYQQLFAAKVVKRFDVVQIDAKRVTLLDVDWSRSRDGVPAATAEALFEVPVTPKFQRLAADEDALDRWQEGHSSLFWGLSFGWRLRDPQQRGKAELWTHVWENHCGAECYPVDSE